MRGEDRAGEIVEREPGQANRLDAVLRQPPLDRRGREHDHHGLHHIPVGIGVCVARVDAQERVGLDAQASLLEGLANRCGFDGLAELHGAAGQAPRAASVPPLLQQQPPRTIEHGATGARHDDGVMADLPAQGFDISDLLRSPWHPTLAITPFRPAHASGSRAPPSPGETTHRGDAKLPAGSQAQADTPRDGSAVPQVDNAR